MSEQMWQMANQDEEPSPHQETRVSSTTPQVQSTDAQINHLFLLLLLLHGSGPSLNTP